MLFVAIILIFLAYASTTDIDYTFSKRGKAIYKLILVDGGDIEEYDKSEKFLERDRNNVSKTINRRHAEIKRGPEALFHLICLFIGVYFYMLFTSWTSIYEHEFGTSVVASNLTLWLRFSGTITGIVYAIVISAINIKAHKKYK